MKKLKLIAAAVLIAPVLVSCSQSEEIQDTIVESSEADTPASSTESAEAAPEAAPESEAEPETGSAFELAVGDCFNDTDANEVSEVPLVPCSEPHDNEVFHTFDLTGDEYPGEDEALRLGFEGCQPEFEPFVGAPYDTSVYEIYPMIPTDGSWNRGDDREVVCSVWIDGELITGTAQGTAR